MLNLLFDYLMGEPKVNWLSIRFSRYKYEKRDKILREYKSQHHSTIFDRLEFFRVAGAGEISISKNCHSRTGSAIGFSIAHTWSDHPLTGGIIGRNEAKRMAEFILEYVNSCPESEGDEKARLEKELEQRIKASFNSESIEVTTFNQAGKL